MHFASAPSTSLVVGNSSPISIESKRHRTWKTASDSPSFAIWLTCMSLDYGLARFCIFNCWDQNVIDYKLCRKKTPLPTLAVSGQWQTCSERRSNPAVLATHDGPWLACQRPSGFQIQCCTNGAVWWWLPVYQSWWKTGDSEHKLCTPRTQMCLVKMIIGSLLDFFSNWHVIWYIMLFVFCLSSRGLDLSRFPVFALRVSRMVNDYSLQRVYQLLVWSFKAIVVKQIKIKFMQQNNIEP